MVLTPPPLISVVPPPLTVRLTRAEAAPTKPRKATVPAVLTVRFASPLTAPENVTLPKELLVSVASDRSVSAWRKFIPATVSITESPGPSRVVPATVSEWSAKSPVPGGPTSPPKLASPSIDRSFGWLTSWIAPPKATVEPVSVALEASTTPPVYVCPPTVLTWESPGPNVVVPVTVSELSANRPKTGSPTSPPKLALPLTVRSHESS